MSEISSNTNLALLDHMVTTRAIDFLEKEYTQRGEAFFHVSSAGHESNVFLAPYLIKQDYLHCHYRDKALLLARGMTPKHFFDALFSNSASVSKGRQMNPHVSYAPARILSMVAPVGNNALQAVGIAEAIKQKKEAPLVLCSLGEGATQQAEFHNAIIHALLEKLPVLFLIQDNEFAISTSTVKKTFYNTQDGLIKELLGKTIRHVKGSDIEGLHNQFSQTVDAIRTTREPEIVVYHTQRLESHTNADDHLVYRSKEEIENLKSGSDPIRFAIQSFYPDTDVDTLFFEKITAKIKELRPIAHQSQRVGTPQPAFHARRDLSPSFSDTLARVPTLQEPKDDDDALTMLKAIREVLRSWLKKNKNVELYGEDLEDPKGDVFGVTKGLSSQFPGKVKNSPLSEALILGSSIGKALVGKRPVAFLQFADFFPIAFNQIYSELASIHWRTAGEWNCPLIIMATYGGYRPGLGPFHAASMEGFSSHIPGLDVYIPSNAQDAAGLLNTAFESERPCIFFYPKNQLNTKQYLISKRDIATHYVAPASLRVLTSGKDLTVIAYGNTVYFGLAAADYFSKVGISLEVLDLRSISPVDYESIYNSVNKTKKALVIHEGNISLGVGAEIVARIAEHTEGVQVRRYARSDTFVPFNFENQLEILPSLKGTIETIAAMCEASVQFEDISESEENTNVISAIGSSPSDESVTIIEWKIKEDDEVEVGQVIAELEADKASIELSTTVKGTVKKLLYEEGDTVPVGTSIAHLTSDEASFKTLTREELGLVTITPLKKKHDSSDSAGILGSPSDTHNDHETSLAEFGSIEHMSRCPKLVRSDISLGEKILTNADLINIISDWSEEQIVQSTGIKHRHWVSEAQNTITMAFDASRKVLHSLDISFREVSGIVCATGTHTTKTPSLAAHVQYLLNTEFDTHQEDNFAYDVSAACSGYVFALKEVYQHLVLHPNELVLVVTSEVLSPFVDVTDRQTSAVFSDAATATLVCGAKHPLASKGFANVTEPILLTRGEPSEKLVVPDKGYISMDGVHVYKTAIAELMNMYYRLLDMHGLSADDIDMVIAHQANQKIINAVQKRLKLAPSLFYSSIERHGNSSSSTVPICTTELIENGYFPNDKNIMVLVFGGGYTFGGTVLKGTGAFFR